MITPLSLLRVAEELSAKVVGEDITFEHVCTDTRAIKPGDLFVALRGENFDAHDFLITAQKNGASALVVEKASDQITIPQLVVPDTTLALGSISALVRSQFSGAVIAITGSCGKTTVKEMVAAILSCRGKVHATRGNFNNHIGMPLTIFELAVVDDFAVLEMGASAGGEIGYLTQLAKPDIALVNNVMPAHVEGFGSVDAIARAKSEIYQGLNSNGIAIVNLDDNYASDMICGLGDQKRLTFSLFDCKADIHAENIKVNSDSTMFTLCYAKMKNEVKLQVIGQHNLSNALAASACAIAAGATLDDVVLGLQRFEAVKGRLNIDQGLNDCTVIDDSYNANPGSVCAAIDAVKNMTGEKILVLGDMAELGSAAKSSHENVGDYARESGFASLYAVGPLSGHAAKAFGVNARSFFEQSELIESLLNRVSADTILLIKGSRSSKMEVIAQALMNSKIGAQQEC